MISPQIWKAEVKVFSSRVNSNTDRFSPIRGTQLDHEAVASGKPGLQDLLVCSCPFLCMPTASLQLCSGELHCPPTSRFAESPALLRLPAPPNSSISAMNNHCCKNHSCRFSWLSMQNMAAKQYHLSCTTQTRLSPLQNQ